MDVNPLMKPSVASTWTVSFLMALLVSACSLVDLDDDRIRIRNNSEKSIFIDAWELQASHTVDPVTSFTVTGDERYPLLETGESVSLDEADVNGGFTMGQDIRLFIWVVSGSEATLKELLDVSGEELESADYVIRIEEI
jgi:hypothetical protein